MSDGIKVPRAADNFRKESCALAQTEKLSLLVQDKGMDELLKPLSREIHLFDTYVAGTTFLDDVRVLDDLAPGQRLTLRREDNPHDEKAILVLKADGTKIGYIPRQDNLIFSRLMDAGKCLEAKVDRTELRGTYHRVEIRIFMVDF